MLSGVPKLTTSKLRKLPANRRRPDRMYGGQLCHLCVKDLLKLEIRGT
jgi:ribosomal protein L34E